jgi:hypothetical protein
MPDPSVQILAPSKLSRQLSTQFSRFGRRVARTRTKKDIDFNGLVPRVNISFVFHHVEETFFDRGAHQKTACGDFGHYASLSQISFRQEHGEFVSADPGDNVGAALAFSAEISHVPYGLVPRVMPEAIVHRLELIDIYD